MRQMRLVTLALVLLSICVNAQEKGPSDWDLGMNSPELQTLADMRITIALLDLSTDLGGVPARELQLVRVAEVAEFLPDALAARLPRTDAWGNEFLLTTKRDGQAAFVVSRGPNGVLEATIDTLDVTAKQWEDDDIVLKGTHLVRGADGHRRKQFRTIASMRALQLAVQEYFQRYGSLPTPKGRFVPAQTAQKQLSPAFIEDYPSRDAWDNPILMWHDGVEVMLVSYGADLLPEVEYGLLANPLSEAVTAPRFFDPRRDIIMIGDRFEQLPEGVSP